MPTSRRLFCLLLPVVAALPAWAADLDPAALDRGSEIAYRRALVPAANERRLNADPAIAVRARRVVNRLVGAAAIMDPAARNYAWAVNVVLGTAPDARAYPGARLIVNHGLFAGNAFSDDEVAAVIASALAHSLLGHDTTRIVARARSRPLSPDPNRQALDMAEATVEALRAPRYTPAEIEAADRASVELLARANYDPRAAGTVWRRLAQTREGIIERAPVSEERLARLDAGIQTAVPLFEETRTKAAAAQAMRTAPAISGKPGPPALR